MHLDSQDTRLIAFNAAIRGLDVTVLATARAFEAYLTRSEEATPVQTLGVDDYIPEYPQADLTTYSVSAPLPEAEAQRQATAAPVIAEAPAPKERKPRKAKVAKKARKPRKASEAIANGAAEAMPVAEVQEQAAPVEA